MKKIIAGLLSMMMTLSLVACGGEDPTINNDIGDHTNSPSHTTSQPFSVDLEGYVANIGNASALGIAKQTSSSSPALDKGGYHLSHLSTNQDTESKNYIVMSTTEYDANTPEADASGLTQVTFTKTITENVTTETTGTKYITATQGQITILAVEGFTYVVSHNDTLIHETVTDNDAIDTNPEDGVIVITGLTDGEEYKVDYSGVGEEITITQDQIDGEIDKLYSMYNYTFISFVPKGASTRPLDEAMTYDHNGVALYDKTNYCSNNQTQSFVIDNTTGYVYYLEHFAIDRIQNGLIITGEKHYDMFVRESGELDFVQVVQNETLNVTNVFKDKYGYKYVLNEFLDGYDAENKTMYYTKPTYILSQEGVTIHMEYTGAFGDASNGKLPGYFKTLEKVNPDFTTSPIDPSETYNFHCSPENVDFVVTEDSAILSHIADGYMYMYATQGGAYTYFHRVHVSLQGGVGGCEGDNVEMSYWGMYSYTGGNWAYGCLKSAPIDYNTVLIWTDWGGTPTLYVGDVWGDQAMTYNVNMECTEFTISNATALLENVVCEPDWTFDFDVLRFRKTTFTETIYYRIVLDENNTPSVVNSKTYVAPAKDVVTLYPINK